MTTWNNRKILLTAFLSAILTFAVFSPSILNDFVNFDDGIYIYENEHIKSLDTEFLKWMFSFGKSLWVPLTRLSHALNYAAWELEPAGHHLTNVILHSFNTFLLVMVIAHLMLNARKFRPEFMANRGDLLRNILIAGCVTGVLFGIHPLRVESVAWVTERKDVLSGFFLLLSMLYYLKYMSETIKQKRFVHYILSIVFFIFAFMSKPIAIILIPVLFLLDIYPFERINVGSWSANSRNTLMEKVPYLAIGAFFMLITLLANYLIRIEIPLSEHLALADRLLLAVRAVCFYLYKMVLPLNLVPFYAYRGEITLLNPDILVSFLMVITITVLCVISWKRNKSWLTVWLFFLITLLPVLGIIKIGYYVAADRYTYLPSTGLSFLAGLGIVFLWEKIKASKNKVLLKKRVLISLCTIISIALSVLTVKQIGIWENSLTLWNAELKQYQSYSIYNSRGMAYLKMEDFQRAIEDYDTAIELNPSYLEAYIYRGICYRSLGNIKMAMKDFNIVAGAKSISRDLAVQALSLRGSIFAETGNYRKARDDYNEALTRDPGASQVHIALASLYERLNDLPKATYHYNRAIELEPKNSQAYLNRGTLFAESGNYQKALENYSMAVQLNPSDAINYYNRGHVYLKLRDDQSAINDFRSAAHLGDRDAQNYLRAKGIQ